MELFAHLKARFPHLPCTRGFDFSRHTTIGCGGSAAAEAQPRTAEEGAALLAWLERGRIPHCILGAGANVLPSDGMFEGVVVRFCRLRTLDADGPLVFAGAGVTGGALLSFAQARGIGGFSPFSGIPMTMGGGTAMNAGVRELHFSDITERVLCASGGELCTLPARECAFGDKQSVFLSGIAVLGVTLRGRQALPEDIARESCYFRTRRRKLPKGRSMGCVFVNPEGMSAGALIEACGLKGARVGGAVVSDAHDNFILNEGATASEIAALIDLIGRTVTARTGIVLREEIRRIP